MKKEMNITKSDLAMVVLVVSMIVQFLTSDCLGFLNIVNIASVVAISLSAFYIAGDLDKTSKHNHR